MSERFIYSVISVHKNGDRDVSPKVTESAAQDIIESELDTPDVAYCILEREILGKLIRDIWAKEPRFLPVSDRVIYSHEGMGTKLSLAQEDIEALDPERTGSIELFGVTFTKN